MAVSRDEVIKGYRMVLDRDPEDEGVIRHHMGSHSTTWQLLESLYVSSERQQRLRRIKHLSLHKCYEGYYLARSLDLEGKIACFLHNHARMSGCLSDANLRALNIHDLKLMEVRRGDRTARIDMLSWSGISNEGETTLLFSFEALPLYLVSFTFVPGAALGLAHRDVLLVSRMQGWKGRIEEAREATRAMRDVAPKTFLFKALQGVAEASGCAAIVGVAAKNHGSARIDNQGDMERAYDNFYRSLGASESEPGFFVMAMPLAQKPLGLVPRGRRQRTWIRREHKKEIVTLSAQAWIELGHEA